VLVALAAVGVVGSLVATACGSHPGGDPDGRLMAAMVPVVTVVPGFEQGRIPWISFPCDTCKWPQTYAIKIEPRWDSCDGKASTAGWDPAIVQIGLVWRRSSQALAATLDSRLNTEGWSAVQTPPSWSEDQASFRTWDFPRGLTVSETLELDSPLDGLGWTINVEAKPVGSLVDCSR